MLKPLATNQSSKTIFKNNNVNIQSLLTQTQEEKKLKAIKRKKNIACTTTTDFQLIFNMEVLEIKRQQKAPNVGDKMAEQKALLS